MMAFEGESSLSLYRHRSRELVTNQTYKTVSDALQRAGAKAALDGAKWAKLCRDCKIVDRRVSPTEVDLTFARVREAFKHRLSTLGRPKESSRAYDVRLSRC